VLELYIIHVTEVIAWQLRNGFLSLSDFASSHVTHKGTEC